MIQPKSKTNLIALSEDNRLNLPQAVFCDCTIELNRNSTTFLYKPGSAHCRQWRLNHPHTSGTAVIANNLPIHKTPLTAPRDYDFKKSMYKVKQLIENNFTDGHAWIGLTFSPKCTLDIQSIHECNKAFHNFIDKLRYHVNGFCHVTVINTQKKRKDYPHAIHYHMVCNLPPCYYFVVQKLWEPWGTADCKQIWGLPKIISYCGKNMKAFEKYSFLHKLRSSSNRIKRYLHSQNLNKEIHIPYTTSAPEKFLCLYSNLSVLEPENISTYDNKYTQERYECYQFNLPNSIIKPQPFATLNPTSKYNKLIKGN